MEPLISVIVPVYNVEKYLDRCVESIVNQTYTNLEIILVDDGSPDNCPKMCDDWAKKDDRIKVIHKKNGGVSSARNSGLDKANGDYIAFVDSDDYMDLDAYEIMLKEILEYKADIASCAIIRESPNGLKENWGEENAEIILKSKNDVLIEICSTLGLMCIHIGNKLFSKNAINNIRFDTKLTYCEDILFNYQVALNINSLVCHNAARYHFYYNIDSATKNRKEFAKFDELKVMDVICELSPEELMPYCVRGNVLKSLNKIKEVVTDGVCSGEEYKTLRQRVVSHRKEILKSNIYTKITKLKVIFLFLFPNTFRFFIKVYGKKQNKKQSKKYLG